MIDGTLVYLFRGNEVLLAMKKRGFGQGKWNGTGGKLKPGEPAIDGAIRETQEEIGVTPDLSEPHGTIHFHDPEKSEWIVHVFRTESFKGDPTETEEMRPQWFPVKAIPYDQCWVDDQYWLPLLIAEKKFDAEFWLKADGGLAKHRIKEL